MIIVVVCPPNLGSYLTKASGSVPKSLGDCPQLCFAHNMRFIA